jgi:flagellar P-ring protein FlgI
MTDTTRNLQGPVRGAHRGPAAWALVALLSLAAAAPARAAARVGDLTTHDGDVPRRLVGYGLVVGLDGTGDRSFGTLSGSVMTVRTVINLLRRFQIEVPPEHLRLRNVAAVAVTAEISPYLRPGGRFEVQVAALGDATSLQGGVLWMTPLVTDPNKPPVATAQGPLYVATANAANTAWWRTGNAGRIPQGGVLEVETAAPAARPARLLLRQPDLGTATRIAAAINAAFGGSAARADDPGAVSLTAPSGTDSLGAGWSVFLAAVDTVAVEVRTTPRVVVDARSGSVVTGGDVRVGAAVVSRPGVTLEIGGPAETPAGEGLVRVAADASVQDVASGLMAAGVKPGELLAILESLRAAGALQAELVVR